MKLDAALAFTLMRAIHGPVKPAKKQPPVRFAPTSKRRARRALRSSTSNLLTALFRG
jgi:hypothetical protein